MTFRIKDISVYRHSLKTSDPAYNNQYYDFNYLGYKHEGNGISGFFRYYHGEKPDIRAFIQPTLQNAEDEQAIYEFIQNAADSDATDIAIFYDHQFFLVVNNGTPFSARDVRSILNMSQSTKSDKSTTADCGKIGRYGIGFKLAHRLVGREEGADELMTKYSGPVIFSWFHRGQLDGLLALQEGQTVVPDDFNGTTYPWLFKILITNFPTHPGETIKDLSYKESICFTNAEMTDLNRFLRQHQAALSNMELDKGSIFFLRFGENKSGKLEDSMRNLRGGIGYALHLLKKMKRVNLNGTETTAEPVLPERFVVPVGSPMFEKIKGEHKDCPIEVMLGFANTPQAVAELKKSPNFYQFFPMGDERHGFAFFVHSTGFVKETNRRKLTETSDTNHILLSHIAQELSHRLTGYQSSNRGMYERLYSVLLYSDCKDDSPKIVKAFYDQILDYLRKNVPVEGGHSVEHSGRVVIKATALNIRPDELGIEKHWFFASNDRQLCQEARNPNKLQLPSWDVSDLIRHGNPSRMSSWIAGLGPEGASTLDKELQQVKDNQWRSNGVWERFCQIGYFQLSDGSFASINQALVDLNILFLHPDVAPLSAIFKKLGFRVSIKPVGNESPLNRLIQEKLPYLGRWEAFLDKIKPRTKGNHLTPGERLTLFETLVGIQDIKPAMLKDWQIFTDSMGQERPLAELLPSQVFNVPDWLKGFMIHADYRKPVVEKYLLKKEQVFELIDRYWDELSSRVPFLQAPVFCQQIRDFATVSSYRGNLSQKAYIPTDNGFKNADSVYYHPKLADHNSYGTLAETIYKLLGKHLPMPNVLPYLKAGNDNPFTTPTNDLQPLYWDIRPVFSAVEISSLLELCALVGFSFVGSYHLVTVAEGFRIVKKSNAHIYYDPKNLSLAELQASNKRMTEHFQPFPKDFSRFERMEGILRGEQLYDKLVEHTLNGNWLTAEELIPVLAEAEFKGPVQRMLKGAEFRLPMGGDLPEWVPMLFDLWQKHLPSKDWGEVRQRIVLVDKDGREIALSVSRQKDEVVFKNGKVSLAAMGIYPNNGLDMLTQLANALRSSGVKQVEEMLGTGESAEVEAYYNDLANHQRKVGHLENADQWAFLIFYDQDFDRVEWAAFHVLTKNGESFRLQNQFFYLNDFPFLRADAPVHPCYQGLAALLQVSEGNPMISFGGNTLCFQPFVDRTGIHLDFVTAGLGASTRLALLDYLLQLWQKGGYVQDDFHKHNWDTISGEDAELVLGFHPSHFVMHPMASIKEALPDWLESWANGEAGKLEMLKAMGAHGDAGNIIRMRQAFLDGEPFEWHLEGLFSALGRPTAYRLLVGTLEWMCEKGIEIITDTQEEALAMIYSRLLPDPFGYPMPFISELREGNLIYSLQFLQEGDYALDDQLMDWGRRVHGGLERLLGLLGNRGSRLIVANIFPGNWQIPLDAIQPEEDFSGVGKDGAYPENQTYKMFQQVTGYVLYDCPSLPAKYHYEGEYLGEGDSLANVLVDEEEKRLFVRKDAGKIEDLLRREVEEGVLEEHIWEVFMQYRDGAEQARIRELEQQLANYQAVSFGGDTAMAVTGADLDTGKQAVVNQEAKLKVKAWLAQRGYDVGDWEEEYSIVRNVRFGGKSITLVVKSAMKGDIFINPNEWLILAENPLAQLIVVGHNGIQNVVLDDIAQYNSVFDMRFRLADLNAEGLSAFAKMFQYVRSSFILKNPDHSYADDFAVFGLYHRMEGTASAQPRNLKD